MFSGRDVSRLHLTARPRTPNASRSTTAATASNKSVSVISVFEPRLLFWVRGSFYPSRQAADGAIILITRGRHQIQRRAADFQRKCWRQSASACMVSLFNAARRSNPLDATTHRYKRALIFHSATTSSISLISHRRIYTWV